MNGNVDCFPIGVTKEGRDKSKNKNKIEIENEDRYMDYLFLD